MILRLYGFSEGFEKVGVPLSDMIKNLVGILPSSERKFYVEQFNGFSLEDQLNHLDVRCDDLLRLRDEIEPNNYYGTLITNYTERSIQYFRRFFLVEEPFLKLNAKLSNGFRLNVSEGGDTEIVPGPKEISISLEPVILPEKNQILFVHRMVNAFGYIHRDLINGPVYLGGGSIDKKFNLVKQKFSFRGNLSGTKLYKNPEMRDNDLIFYYETISQNS